MENMRFENVWRVLRNYNFELSDGINNELLCTICKKIMINACNSPCGCRYCNDCLRNYLQRTEKFCPGESDDCKNVLINFDKNVSIDQPINAKIAQLQMKCPENCSDCLIELREMENHIRVCNRQRRFCPFTNIVSAEQKKMIFQGFLIFIFCLALINFVINNKLIGMKFLENNQSELIDLHTKLERLEEKLKILEVINDQKYKENIIDQTEFIWNIDNFNEKLKKAETGTIIEIFSDPFLSHKNGYKLQLYMYPNGDETAIGENISLYICIMKGDNDDSLPWPFQYDVTFQLINQRTNSIHFRETGTYDQLPNNQNWDRPKSFRNIGFGFSRFLSLEDLKTIPGLIENDKVVVKCIVHIPNDNSINLETVNSNQFTWIINHFSEKHKKAISGNDLEIYSDSFFSHKNGYKLRLVIYPNGYGESAGKYLSIYFGIMKGRFDDQLSWPFKVNVTFELINQHTNSVFSGWILDNEFLADHPCRNKPTTSGNDLLGFPKFIELEQLFGTPGLIYNDQIIIRATTEI